MKKPHITQEIGFYLTALFLVGATLVSIMPTRDCIDDLEIRVNYERGF